uniref:Uncharacterized protein n=1 Tax=Anguilla anguilla TaxID=7936 RepID=A0A0E9P6T5_ANGAN
MAQPMSIMNWVIKSYWFWLANQNI